MIPWSISEWSTNDALHALGLRHVSGEIRRGDRVVFRGSVFMTNQWLFDTEQLGRMPGVLTLSNEQDLVAAQERAA
jgi:hypothetical protein